MAGKAISHSEDLWATRCPAHVVRCSASLRSGGQCKREAFPGMNVCGHHGGHLPVNVAAAFTRLGGTVEAAADTVAEVMGDKSVPPRDRLAAAAHVMKLLGMEKERVEVKVSVDPLEALFRAIAADPVGLAPASDGNASEAELVERQRAWRELVAADDDVVDAEVVEDPSADSTSAQIEEAAEAAPVMESGRTPTHIRESIARELRTLL